MSNKRQPNIQKNGKQYSNTKGEKCAAFEGRLEEVEGVQKRLQHSNKLRRSDRNSENRAGANTSCWFWLTRKYFKSISSHQSGKLMSFNPIVQ